MYLVFSAFGDAGTIFKHVIIYSRIVSRKNLAKSMEIKVLFRAEIISFFYKNLSGLDDRDEI